jgi:nitroreductase
MDLGTTDELLTTTRAVRKRLDLARPVGREVVLDCVRVAQQAPTGGNRQGWSFVVVTDAGKRAELARLYREASGNYFEEARAKARSEQTARVYDGAQYLLDVLDRVPVHVIPCIRGRADGQPNSVAAGLYGSILPAVWSFQLALRARGLGSAWTTMHLFREREAAELLGIPPEVTQVALLPVAYYTGERFAPAERPAPETITHWDTWQD